MKNDIAERLEAVATLMNSGERARDQGKTPDYKPKAGKLHTTRASRTTSITVSVWEEGRRVCASFVWVVSRSVFVCASVKRIDNIQRQKSHISRANYACFSWLRSCEITRYRADSV